MSLVHKIYIYSLASFGILTFKQPYTYCTFLYDAPLHIDHLLSEYLKESTDSSGGK